MTQRRNALFSFAPGFLTGKQRRARGRQPYNRRVAGMVRKARKHKYDFAEDFGNSVRSGKGMAAVRSDVAQALKGQGFPSGRAKKLARSASGSDFDSIFRSALTKAKENPVAKKRKSKKRKNSRKGKMPAGLKAYWAKKRGKKNSRRRKKKNSRRRNRRPRVRTIVKTKIVYRNKRRKKVARRRKRANPRPKMRSVRIPGTVTPRQRKAIGRFLARATGMRIVHKRA